MSNIWLLLPALIAVIGAIFAYRLHAYALVALLAIGAGVTLRVFTSNVKALKPFKESVQSSPALRQYALIPLFAWVVWLGFAPHVVNVKEFGGALVFAIVALCLIAIAAFLFFASDVIVLKRIWQKLRAR
jgi:hypothetical protein